MTIRIRVAVGAAAVLLVCAGVLTAGQAQGQTRTPANKKAPMILFMCPTVQRRAFSRPHTLSVKRRHAA